MTNFQPEDNGLPFKLLCAIQQMLVQVQNLYVTQRDLLRNQLNDMCKLLPRTYNELQDLEENMIATIRCIERGFGKKKGEEESDAMRSFIRHSLASEHLKTYPNEAIRQAMNDALNTLSRKGEEQPDSLKCSSCFVHLKTTWRWITIPTESVKPGATISQAASQASAEPEVVRTERAMLACATQIVAENQAKQAGRNHEPRPKPGDDAEKAQMRKELADMKNQLNQQKKRNDELRKNKA